MRRSAAWTLAVLTIAGFLSYTDRYVINVLVTEIRGDLSLTDLQLGLVQGTAFAVIYACAGLPLGWMADRTNRRNLILVGLTAWCLGTGACAFANSFAALFAARLAVGLGEACLFPAAFSLINACFSPSRRGMAIGVLMTGVTLGAGAAVAIGAGLLAWLQGPHAPALGWPFPPQPWRQVLAIVAVAGLPVLALVATLHEPVEGEGAARLPPPTMAESLAAVRPLTPVLLPLVAAIALVSLTDAALGAWAPAFFVRRFGFDAAGLGLQLGSVILITSAAGALIGGKLSDLPYRGGVVEGRQRAAAIAATLALPASMFAIAGTPGLALFGYGAWLLLFNIAGTASVAATQDMAPRRLHGMFAATTSFTYAMAGLGVGPAMVAMLTDGVFHDPGRVGLSMAAVGALALCVAIVALWAALAANIRLRKAAAASPAV